MWQQGEGTKKKGEKKIFKPESVGNHWHESGEGTREKKKKKRKKIYRNLIANSSLVRRNGRVSVSGSTFFL